MQQGLPPLNVALKWLLKCYAEPNALPSDKDESQRMFDRTYKALSPKRWSSKKHEREGTPWNERLGYTSGLQIAQAMRRTRDRAEDVEPDEEDVSAERNPDAANDERKKDDKREKLEGLVTSWVGAYRAARPRLEALNTDEALWQFIEHYFVPLVAGRATKRVFTSDPVSHILASTQTCPVRAYLNHRDGIEAPVWFLPTLDDGAWRTPVANVLERVYALLGVTRYGFAYQLVKPAVEAEPELDKDLSDVSIQERWDQKLYRWSETWTQEWPSTLPHIQELASFADIYEHALKTNGERQRRANLFVSFLELPDKDKREYLVEYYRRNRPDSVGDVRANIGGFTQTIDRFALEWGRITPSQLFQSLLTARAVQAACFGTGQSQGLWHLAARRYGKANADAKLKTILDIYRSEAYQS